MVTLSASGMRPQILVFHTERTFATCEPPLGHGRAVRGPHEKEMVMWYIILAERVDDVKFGHVHILRRALRRW